MIDGGLVNIGELFKTVIEGLDLHLLDSAEYELSKVSRSFREKTSESCHGGAKDHRKKQRVLVLEKRKLKPTLFSSNNRKQAVATTTRKIVSKIEDVRPGMCVALASDNTDRHIHSLGRYPSRFIPELPRWAIETYSQPGDLVLDPFVGSGTTAVEAAILGRHCLAADISPYACLLTEAKASAFRNRKIDDLQRRFQDLGEALSLTPCGRT